MLKGGAGEVRWGRAAGKGDSEAERVGGEGRVARVEGA